MIFALAQPAACAGLLLGLVIALAIRVLAQTGMLAVLYQVNRPGGMWPVPRRDIHPMGIIAAVIGGTGFGTSAPVLPSRPGRWRPAAIYLAGPVATVAVAEILLAGYAEVYPAQLSTGIYLPSDVLRGVPAGTGDTAGQLWFSLAVAVLSFGLVAVLPLPPADGWGLTGANTAMGATGRGVRSGRHLGAFAIMLALIVPVGGCPPLHLLLDIVGAPLIRVWSGALRCRGASRPSRRPR